MNYQPTCDAYSWSPTNTMQAIRTGILGTPADLIGIEKTDEYPTVYGVLLEFPLRKCMATLVSMCDGNASLHTTSAVGLLGGCARAGVRAAATAFVKTAASVHDDAIPASDYPNPAADRVRFYLLTFSGVRIIDIDRAAIEAGHSQYARLFDLGQEVLTQLRLATHN